LDVARHEHDPARSKASSHATAVIVKDPVTLISLLAY